MTDSYSSSARPVPGKKPGALGFLAALAAWTGMGGTRPRIKGYNPMSGILRFRGWTFARSGGAFGARGRRSVRPGRPRPWHPTAGHTVYDVPAQFLHSHRRNQP